MKKTLQAENMTQEGQGQFLSCAQFFSSWAIALEVALSSLDTVMNPHFISCLSPRGLIGCNLYIIYQVSFNIYLVSSTVLATVGWALCIDVLC